MKINELKVGDTIKYSTDKTTDKTYQAEIIEVWPDKLSVSQARISNRYGYGDGLGSYFIRKDQVVSKIETVTEVKEIPITHPSKPVVFLFQPSKTSQSLGYPEPLYDRGIAVNICGSIWESTKVEGVDSNGNYMYLELPKALEINPYKKYRISIEEIDF